MKFVKGHQKSIRRHHKTLMRSLSRMFVKYVYVQRTYIVHVLVYVSMKNSYIVWLLWKTIFPNEYEREYNMIKLWRKTKYNNMICREKENV